MIRRCILNINYANKGKLEALDSLMIEMQRVVNAYIDELWLQQDFKSTYVTFKVESFLSATILQSLGKQALAIVKSQRKKKIKTKPVFNKMSFELDSRMVDFQFDNNSFDIWIRLSRLGQHLILKLPSKKHKHFNKFKDWKLKQSIRLRKVDDNYTIECFFQKLEPEKKSIGKTIGCDQGYKKLLIDNEGIISDLGLEQIYEKIVRKKQGSKAFKRALKERNNLINRSLNKKDLSDVKEIVVEDLTDIKKNSKKKIFYKKFNNKLQRWTYTKVLHKLSMRCEEEAVLLTRVSPQFTSQRCSSCGVICKLNRVGLVYKCACGNEMDADLNAAKNLSHMGVYSPHALQITIKETYQKIIESDLDNIVLHTEQNEEIYVSLHKFKGVDPDFIEFIRDMQDYDNAKNENFYVVEL